MRRFSSSLLCGFVGRGRIPLCCLRVAVGFGAGDGGEQERSTTDTSLFEAEAGFHNEGSAGKSRSDGCVAASSVWERRAVSRLPTKVTVEGVCTEQPQVKIELGPAKEERQRTYGCVIKAR